MKYFIMIMLLVVSPVNAAELSTVTSKTAVISVKDKTTAGTMIVSKYLDSKASYDEVKKELSFTVNETSSKPSWRLVHDGTTVLSFMYSKGITGTIYKIYEGSYDDCLKEIEALKLEVSDEILDMAAMQYKSLNK